jgi:hypothetical protein
MMISVLVGDDRMLINHPNAFDALADQLVQSGVDRAAISIDAVSLAQWNLHMAREQLREAIVATAGDTASLLGTTADATQLLLKEMAELAYGLSTAQSLADVRTAALPFAELTSALIDELADGTVKLPYLTKGVGIVMTEIKTRATAVSNAMIAAGNAGV